MRYQAQLLNRFEQFDRVDYDLLIQDADGELPDLRSGISLSTDQDRPAVINALRVAALSRATADQQPGAKRARLQALRDAAFDAMQAYQALRDQLQGRLDRNDI